MNRTPSPDESQLLYFCVEQTLAAIRKKLRGRKMAESDYETALKQSGALLTLRDALWTPGISTAEFADNPDLLTPQKKGR
jgi:hypothetical protein